MTHRHTRKNPHNITFASIEKIAADEDACLIFFEACRFPNGLKCHSCGASEVDGSHFTRHRSRRGLYTCASCRRQFTLTSGTAMHRTRLPLGQWLRAIWLVIASSKGLSARKLGEMLGITYKVAWHKHFDFYLDELSWRHNRRTQGHLFRIMDALSSAGRPLPQSELSEKKSH